MSVPNPLKLYVSAGSRGLGFEIARRLARDGARIALSARSRDRLDGAAARIRQECPDSSVLTISGDLSLAKDQERILDTLREHDFWPDVFVCNAGQPASVSFEKVTRQEWQQGLDMILGQAVFAVQRFVPVMAQRGYGRVIFVSSIHAKYPSILPPEYFLSCVARSAFFALAKVIQGQYASRGVAAFTLVLGYVDTPLLRNAASGRPSDAEPPLAAPGQPEPWRSRYKDWADAVPARRIGSAEELADLVAFLTSQAADYLGGNVLSFAGGMDRGIL